MPGAPRAASICACVTDSKPSTWRAACMSCAGETTALAGTSNSPTSGAPTIVSSREAICASPSGVSASPRKSNVATRTSPASPKSSSISTRAWATALPRGSVPSVSGGGSRSPDPAASSTVTTRSTASVVHGRAVTSRLSAPSALSMTRPASPRQSPRSVRRDRVACAQAAQDRRRKAGGFRSGRTPKDAAAVVPYGG